MIWWVSGSPAWWKTRSTVLNLVFCKSISLLIFLTGSGFVDKSLLCFKASISLGHTPYNHNNCFSSNRVTFTYFIK